MVGRLLLSLLFVIVPSIAQARQCDVFKQKHCNLGPDSVLLVNDDISSPQECQTACFEKKRCIEFTYFTDGDESKCIFFKSCDNPKLSCENCISGPVFPRVATCLSQALKDRRRRKQGGGRSRSGSGGFNKPLRNKAQQRKEQSDDEADLDNEDDEDNEDNEVNVDDGLLDAIFEDLPDTEVKATTTTTEEPAVKDESSEQISNQDECPLCDGFYYCVLGGSNANGPISTVAIMNTGLYSVPSTSFISSFPTFMTQGNGITFSLFSTSLRTCTPGYQISTFLNNNIQSTFVPGSCNGYNFSTEKWISTGGTMATFRDGGSTFNVGSYIMSVGGLDQYGKKMSSLELFDPKRPEVGWKDVPQWSFPQATKDQCAIVTKDKKLGTQVMLTGGLGEEHSVMKLVLSKNNWYSVPPMKHPRTKHGCTSVTLNGRPGVVVSGGIDTERFNTSSVEFFDMKTQKWIDLPDLKRGRHGHAMSTIDGKLVVAGGAVTGRRGEEEYLDEVEVFDGKRWKKANYKLDQPRSGANLVKIPIRSFKG